MSISPLGTILTPFSPGRLAVAEEMTQSAITTFQQLRARLDRDDWIALEAEAETLKLLFESERQ